MRQLFVAFAIGASTLAACAGEADSGGCETAADCVEGAFCQSGVCIEPCTDDEACSDGRRCLDGVCREVSSCVDTEDCEAGWVCDQRSCVPQEPECASDRDCPPRFACIEGGCYPPGLACDDTGDCEAGAECIDGVCVEPGTDSGTDSGTADAGADTDEEIDTIENDTRDAAADTAEPECVRTTDCGTDEVCIDGVCVSDTDTGTPDADLCEGRADGQLGERCTRASDCCNGMCFGNPEAGRGVCSEECNNWRDCNPIGAGGDELFCYALTTPGLCAVSDWLDSCASADTCLGGRCLVAAASQGCSWDCETTSDCAPGAACGGVAFNVGGTPTLLDVCTPVGANCLTSTDCLSGTCLTDDGGGLGYCSVFCNPSASSCPSGWSCQAPDLSQPDLYVCVR